MRKKGKERTPAGHRTLRVVKTRRDQRDKHKEQKVYQEQPAIVTPDVVEDAVMGHPVEADYEEADHVAKELGLETEQPARQLRRYQVVRYLGHLDVQSQQGDSYSEDGVAKEDGTLY
jgi:hypothetical protein